MVDLDGLRLATLTELNINHSSYNFHLFSTSKLQEDWRHCQNELKKQIISMVARSQQTLTHKSILIGLSGNHGQMKAFQI